MELADIQKINRFLDYGDPYTFTLLTVDNENLAIGQTGYWEGKWALDVFWELVKKKFSSGMILMPFEEDMFIAFAPFILDRNYMMDTFDILQKEYYECIKKRYPEKEVFVSIGCVTGTKRSSMEELCLKAEKLIVAIKRQGKHGYKIVEN